MATIARRVIAQHEATMAQDALFRLLVELGASKVVLRVEYGESGHYTRDFDRERLTPKGFTR
jgi:hypothetical protein